MALALTRTWLRLHGSAAGASLTPQDAVRKQLSVDADPGSIDGIKAAMRRATPAQSLAIALEIAEPRLLRLAVEEVARKPQLLKEVDFAAASAQAIWAQALTLNPEAWRGPVDPQRSFAAIIQNLLDGGAASMELIAALAMTPVADLSGVPRRAEVWSRLANPAQANLLEATAARWLDRASSAEVDYVPDPELEAAILAGNRLDHALLAPAGAGAAVRIVSALPNYDESRFLRWLRGWSSTQRPMTPLDADALGRLILGRDWRLAVDQLVHLARMGRADVKPALRICHDMIGIFTRWSLGLSSVSKDEKWIVLEDLAADLYPNGPDYNELWDRAGGRDADLQSYGSGRSRWRDAIAQMRRGNGPRPAHLLDEMKRDFPSNDDVRYLASDPEFRGGYR